MHVIKGFVEVAHALKITTIARWNEKEQIDLVKDMGFDVVQGYFYSKPLPINEYLALIKRFFCISKLRKQHQNMILSNPFDWFSVIKKLYFLEVYKS